MSIYNHPDISRTPSVHEDAGNMLERDADRIAALESQRGELVRAAIDRAKGDK